MSIDWSCLSSPTRTSLHPSPAGIGGQGAELAGADHAGLVNHQHSAAGQRALVEPALELLDVLRQPGALGGVGDRGQVAGELVGARSATRSAGVRPRLCKRVDRARGVDAGTSGQLVSGDPGRRRAANLDSRQVPGMPRRGQREGLAGPGPPDHHRSAVAASDQVLDHGALIRAEGVVLGQRRPHRCVGDDGDLFAATSLGAGDELVLDRQDLGVVQRASRASNPVTGITRPSAAPVGELLQLRREAGLSLGRRARMRSWRVNVDACSVTPAGPTTSSRTSSGFPGAR